MAVACRQIFLSGLLITNTTVNINIDECKCRLLLKLQDIWKSCSCSHSQLSPSSAWGTGFVKLRVLQNWDLKKTQPLLCLESFRAISLNDNILLPSSWSRFYEHLALKLDAILFDMFLTSQHPFVTNSLCIAYCCKYFYLAWFQHLAPSSSNG